MSAADERQDTAGETTDGGLPERASVEHPLVVEVTGARVTLGGAPVLHGVDLQVRAGEFVALLGANGSGKSTLMRAAVGVLPLSGGEAKLFGAATAHRRTHDRLGYVPQGDADAGSIPSTARETVATGLLGSRTWRLRRHDPRVDRALDAVGMLPLAGRPITRMSGGQRRRVMIARALVRAPELLVLDEPFAGIDLASQEHIAALFRDLSDAGTTILVILHETGALTEDIDRAVILDHGRVIHDGPAAQQPALDLGDHHHHPSGLDEDFLGQEIHPA
jgi:zinc transport system ATP-binding protein